MTDRLTAGQDEGGDEVNLKPKTFDEGKLMLKYAALIVTILSASACSFTTASLVPSDGSIQGAGMLGDTREFSSFASRRDLLTEIHGNRSA